MKNIFVGNLSFGATEAAVRSLFEAYGAVERVNIVTDRDTGQARGFGFVEMTEDAGAERAIEALNGYPALSKLRLQLAVSGDARWLVTAIPEQSRCA